MKKLILNIFSLLALGTIVNAQVGVGIEGKTPHNAAILDFPDKATKGILLPRVNDTSKAGTTPGTFVYNKSSNKVLVYGTNNWIELTTEANNSALDGDLNPVGKIDTEKGVVIEDGTSTTPAPEGALTLESKNRALALPVVKNVAEIPSPKAGLICYDKESNSLAIFNGKEWYFWN